jgi:hypothetical protein
MTLFRASYPTVIAALLLLASCASGKEYAVDTEFYDNPFSASVDSELASYFVSKYLHGGGTNSRLNDRITKICSSERPKSAIGLEQITVETSHDFASLCLADSLMRAPTNRKASEIFMSWREKLSKVQDGAPEMNELPKNLRVMFVPGWLYLADNTTGADFRKQRNLLSHHGISNELIPTDENGTIEQNARIIADYLKKSEAKRGPIILVSASKGGPETALALRLVKDNLPSESLLAWINVGGVLRGTALADKAESWPWSWFAKLFVLKGRSAKGIESLRVDTSVERAEEIGSLEDLIILNYVGIPMQSQISERARLGFNLMKEHGPNDGLTYIIDAIQAAERGHTIVELGLDHYYAHPRIDEITLALAYTVVDLWSEH